MKKTSLPLVLAYGTTAALSAWLVYEWFFSWRFKMCLANVCQGVAEITMFILASSLLLAEVRWPRKE